MTTGEAVKSISVEEAKEKLSGESAQAIDTRPAADWAGAHPLGALNLPLLRKQCKKKGRYGKSKSQCSVH